MSSKTDRKSWFTSDPKNLFTWNIIVFFSPLPSTLFLVNDFISTFTQRLFNTLFGLILYGRIFSSRSREPLYPQRPTATADHTCSGSFDQAIELIQKTSKFKILKLTFRLACSLITLGKTKHSFFLLTPNLRYSN